MKTHLTQLLTSRNDKRGTDWGIVEEWEDVLANELELTMANDNRNARGQYFLLKFPWLAQLWQTWKPSFLFTMLPLGNPSGNNKKNIVTCIIDFFLKDKDELMRFYNTYDKNPFVLISSKEAYDFLKSENCPLKIYHWALSIADKYRISKDTTFEKKYDIVMLGRQNPVLLDFLKKYETKHPDVTYVYKEKTEKGWEYFTNKGKSIGTLPTREDYMNLLCQSRAGLYATPGMDGTRHATNGFNQVTPRFLEYLVSGCHVLARYPKNSDTDYYELERFSPNLETYKQFETALDNARREPVNMAFYADYLAKHYTSIRAKQLKEILKNHE